MKNLKKLTILHSNDMHGDFLEEAEENGKTSVLSTSARDVVEEYITVNQHLAREVEGRLVVEA